MALMNRQLVFLFFCLTLALIFATRAETPVTSKSVLAEQGSAEIEIGVEGIVEIKDEEESAVKSEEFIEIKGGATAVVDGEKKDACGAEDLDHLECDIETLQITPEQLELVKNTYNSEEIQSEETKALAAKSGLEISEHFIYRYYASAKFDDLYHGKSMLSSIKETVEWRADFGISKIDTEPLREVISKGMAYVDDTVDKNNKAIIYIRVNDMGPNYVDLLEPLIMYTVEKAQNKTVKHGNGEFVCMIDLDGMTWGKSPPLGMSEFKFKSRIKGLFLYTVGILFNVEWCIRQLALAFFK